MRGFTAFAASLFTLYVAVSSCSSSNCPLSNEVLCNIYFYDADGNSTTLSDTLTVSTLLDGYRQVYVYRKLGSTNIVLDSLDNSLIEAGFSVSVSTVRNDSVIANKVANVSSVSVPISYYRDCDTLLFQYSSASSYDTVKISHTNYTYVELPECGMYRCHSISGVVTTNVAIDAVEVTRAKIDYEGYENIRLYLSNVSDE